MKHEILIRCLPDGTGHDDGMIPFNLVRQNKILPQGAAVMMTVGLRYAGWFRCTGAESEKQARSALKYGLMQAQYTIGSSDSIDYDTLFTERREELIAAANTALAESDSPVRLEEVLFSYLEYCVHDGSMGKKNQRYTGIMIGSMGSHTMVHHKSDGENQWQCVCGAYTDNDKDTCGDCGLAKPVYEDPALEL